MASRFLTSSGRHLASCAMPPLPGAQTTSLTRDDCSSFQTSECSRPPPPNTRTLPAIGETYRVGSEFAGCQRAELRSGQQLQCNSLLALRCRYAPAFGRVEGNSFVVLSARLKSCPDT